MNSRYNGRLQYDIRGIAMKYGSLKTLQCTSAPYLHAAHFTESIILQRFIYSMPSMPDFTDSTSLSSHDFSLPYLHVNPISVTFSFVRSDFHNGLFFSVAWHFVGLHPVCRVRRRHFHPSFYCISLIARTPIFKKRISIHSSLLTKPSPNPCRHPFQFSRCGLHYVINAASQS